MISLFKNLKERYKNKTAKDFESLGLSSELCAQLKKIGYQRPSPIQSRAIPFALDGKDVVGIAQTGTGKTAAFLLPMIDLMKKRRRRANMPTVLIISPTRELATQIGENFDEYTQHTKLSYALLIGGKGMDKQEKKLSSGVDFVIATPGRFMDLFEKGRLLLNNISGFVIDEADRMLDMGFIPDIETIRKIIPAQVQTLMFTATFPPEIRSLAERFLIDPIEVKVAPPATTAKKISQSLIKLSHKKEKNDVLATILTREKNIQSTIIFCNRKRDIRDIWRHLKNHRLNVGTLHGDMTQKEREQTLSDFDNEKIKTLICSDVAARGIDIDHISHVINYDIPFNADDYVHRIGRTGRAGRKGIAFTFYTEEDLELLSAVEKKIGNTLKANKTYTQKNKNKPSTNILTKILKKTPKENKKGTKKVQTKQPYKKPSPHTNTLKQKTPTHKNPYNSQEKLNRTSKKATPSRATVKGFGNDLPDFMK